MMISDSYCQYSTISSPCSMSQVDSVAPPSAELDISSPCLESLFLRISIYPVAIQCAIGILHKARSTRLREVTVDLTSEHGTDIAQVIEYCNRTATIELLSELERSLCEYPIHHASCSLDTRYVLHARKSISWGEEYRKSRLAHRHSLLPQFIEFRCSESSDSLTIVEVLN